MIRRTGLMACALSLMFATAAWAQAGDVSGMVTHVDPAAKIIYFADGRWARVEPGARLTVDGREVAIEALKPGMTVAMGRSMTPGPAPGVPISTHPPIDASGVVTSVDPQTGIITFQDGRMVKVTDRSTVWQQPANMGALRPGAQVFVHNAQPIAFQFGASGAPQTSGRYTMGTIVRVDPASSVAVLSDGTLVRIAPNTKMRMDNQPMTIHQLQPGDQVVIWQPAAVAAVTTPSAGGQADSPSAMPRQGGGYAATIDAQDIVIMRRPQSP